MPNTRPAKLGTPLSDREVDVLALVAKGATNTVVAQTLWLSTDTVKTHLSRSQQRLGTRDRTSTVAAAIAVGALRVKLTGEGLVVAPATDPRRIR